MQRCVPVRGKLIVLIGALIYAYIYMLRIQPGAMLTELMDAYHVSVTELAQIVTIYLPIYLLLQLPAGILLDHYGCKKILIMSLCCCILGVTILNRGEHTLFLLFGRIFIGIGSAAVFLAVLKLVSKNMSQRYFPLAVGFISTCSMLMAYRGERLIAWTVTHYSWQMTNDFFAGMGCLLVLFLCFLPKQYYSQRKQTQLKPVFWRQLRLLLLNKRIIINMVITGLLYTPLALLAEFWGGYYVNLIHPNAPIHYSEQVSLFFVGWAFGAPFFGWLAKWFPSERFLMLIMSPITAILLILLYVAFIRVETSFGIYFLFIGFFASCQVLGIASAKQLCHESNYAICFALTNTGVMMVNYLVQLFFNVLLSFDINPLMVYWILPVSLCIAIALLWRITRFNSQQPQYVALSESD